MDTDVGKDLEIPYKPQCSKNEKKNKGLFPQKNLKIHLRLDLVNIVVRPLLFTKLSLFTKSNLDKE